MKNGPDRAVGLFVLAAAAAIALQGEARGVVVQYQATLNGPNESPPNPSLGTGFATFDYDTTAHTLHVHATFQGLTGTTTASHIHSATTLPGQGTAGVATQVPSFIGFPLGVTSGLFDNTLDLTQASSWNPAFVTANGGTPTTAEAALISGINSGSAYLNIHSTNTPGGEIRGFLQPVPAPGATALLGVGALWIARRRR
jgi:hypothetical protein